MVFKEDERMEHQEAKSLAGTIGRVEDEPTEHQEAKSLAGTIGRVEDERMEHQETKSLAGTIGHVISTRKSPHTQKNTLCKNMFKQKDKHVKMMVYGFKKKKKQKNRIRAWG